MTTLLLNADCGDVLGDRLFHLIYADPPFFTQQTFETTDGETAFSDKWESLPDYLHYVEGRLAACWDRLLPGGSLILHVDPRTAHHFRVDLDRFCGPAASEIIWRYRRWPAKTPNFQKVHDVLLRYVKPGAPPIFNQLYEPLAESTQKQWGAGKQKAVVGEDGKRQRSSVTDDASPGVPLGDVWDISIIAPSAHERTGYPTQKPEKLLERIVLSLSNPGDDVLDPFCGSGTTVAVAARLGRNSVGIDISAVAIAHATARLEVACVS